MSDDDLPKGAITHFPKSDMADYQRFLVLKAQMMSAEVTPRDEQIARAALGIFLTNPLITDMAIVKWVREHAAKDIAQACALARLGEI